ncbi:tRNA-dihydrouridine synthase family protein [Bacteroides fragilis]|jgi:tRNA-dihydrouridine synthase B|uniref:tRNA-dihydrouridine synthase family protein n=1 Tax=Bacteroides fragilis TaxID=817 RepID=UPI0022AA4023|nr:tRNA-dihydrouridine synthase family protein [Bacteroides fragilis]MCE9399052.1 tRNA-dihydrouridine synthase family protein [Bacteroides fragilis]MCZ2503067.1 tRNA-dihydrouridine synthase family protein [Bacteroides fragilis]
MNTLPIHLAPLQGYTEAAYRNAHAAVFGGVDVYHTPFVRIDRGEFRHKDVRDILPENNRVPHLIPQLIASEMDKTERIIALFIEQGYREMDINLGCPFPMLAKRQCGSGMLPHPDKVETLLKQIEQYPDVSFSVKMRLGWEKPDECLTLLPLLNAAPLTEIIVHPRLGIQQYKGEVNMEGFTAFYEACRHPVIYNGDILTIEDIRCITEKFPKLTGVMIGRGLLANPALGWEYKEGRKLTPEEWREKLRALHTAVFQHYETQIQGGEAQLVTKMKTFWEYLVPQIDRKIWKAIHKSTTLAKYNIAVRSAL